MSFYENLRSFNAQIEFFESERDYAFNRIYKIEKSLLPFEIKRETILEWTKIIKNLEDDLFVFLKFKKDLIQGKLIID